LKTLKEITTNTLKIINKIRKQSWVVR